MKKSNLSFTFSALALFSIICIHACIKSSNSSKPKDAQFNFTYNGKTYSLPQKDGTAEWAIVNGGVYINRPDLFEGIIYFPKSDCAYLEPPGSGVQADDNCQLLQDGLTIDSTAVYVYQSGTKSVNYSNCRSGSHLDPNTGDMIPYEVCDVDGTFNLTLKNSENKIISITDGSFHVNSLEK